MSTSNQIAFTQGDANVVLSLTAVSISSTGVQTPINITGGSFSTQILGPNNASGGPQTFGNSQHVITNAALGQFTLTLTQANTQACGIGNNKDILTTITLGGTIVNVRGSGILTVWPPVPLA